MMHVNFSSLLLLLVVCILVPPAASLQTATGVAQAPSSNKKNVDKFGITEIYPTASSGGNEWYINMSYP